MSSDRIWFGQFSNTALNKPGLRHKYPGRPWEEPYKGHIVPLKDDTQSALLKRYNAGLPVAREELAEASAIYDAQCFARQKHVTGGAMAYLVDEPLATLLSGFDTGPGGLIPYTIYEADEVTPIAAKWWLLGLGAQKDTLRGDQSQNVEMIFDGGGEENTTYAPLHPNDDDLAFSTTALDGADWWAEKRLLYSFAFSDRLGSALMENGYGKLFGLKTARVVL